MPHNKTLLKVHIILKIIPLFFIALLVFCNAGLIDTQAYYDEIRIRAGYYGYPFIDKGTYTVDDIRNMGTYTDFYTYYDKANRAVYSEAEGISLYNLMVYSGINPEEINRFNFTVFDGRYTGSQDFTADYLLFTNRYKYPLLSDYYDYRSGAGLTDHDAVQGFSVPVETMIAVDSNWIRTSDFWVKETDETLFEDIIAKCDEDGRSWKMNGSELLYQTGNFDEYYAYATESGEYQYPDSLTRFRLELGQTGPLDGVAGNSAQGISEILVTYAGHPELTADDSLEVKVGEDNTINVSLTAADQGYADLLFSGLKYESSDPGVVTVDQTGKITATGEGEAYIHIYHDRVDSTVSQPLEKYVHISTVKGEDEGGGDGEDTPQPPVPDENLYSVTYRDGVQGTVFEDVVYRDIAENTPTPSFGSSIPEREGYTFKGWSPSVASKVTADAVYTATWQEDESNNGSGSGSGSGSGTGGQGGNTAGRASNNGRGTAGSGGGKSSGSGAAQKLTTSDGTNNINKVQNAEADIKEAAADEEAGGVNAKKLYMNEAGGSGSDGASAASGSGDSMSNDPVVIEIRQETADEMILILLSVFLALGAASMYVYYRKEFGKRIIPVKVRTDKA